MLITFKSEAGDVMMFGDVAIRLLEIIGKKLEKQGIITVEQMPDAIGRLKQAAATDKARRIKTPEEDESEHDRTSPEDRHRSISLAVRAVPFIELLERSLKEKTPVVWGV